MAEKRERDKLGTSALASDASEEQQDKNNGKKIKAEEGGDNGGGNSSSDDDVPLASLFKAATSVKKEEEANCDPMEEDSDDDDDMPLASLVAAAATTNKDEDNGSSSDDVPLSKLVNSEKKKRAAVQQKYIDDEDEEEEAVEEEEEDDSSSFIPTKRKAPPKKKKATKKKPPAKKKKKAPLPSDDESSSSDDIPLAQLVKKKAPRKKKPAAKKKRAATTSSKKKTTSTKKPKKEEEPVWDWWNDEPLPKGVKWRKLKHQGVFFVPEYEPLPEGVYMIYDGEPVELTPEQEEPATWFSRYLTTDHYKKDIFKKNFFADWLAILNEGVTKKKDKHIIKKFDKCDFSAIKAHMDEVKEAKKKRTKEEKKAEKEAKEKIVAQFGWAEIDGHKQKMGNYTVEPPGLFLGRGTHPKAGKIKHRVYAEQVTLNLSKDSPIPKAPKGHKWKSVEHDNKKTWLAKWTEGINGNTKYVFLSAASRTKGMSDRAKFDKARGLRDNIGKVRKDYKKDFKSDSEREQQRAVCIYLIDVLALRVGGEKDTSEVADTVGCCSLRCEHVDVLEENQIKLDFLGKDSMRYENTVTCLPDVIKCIKKFKKGKEGSEQLFDEVNPSMLNKHLKQYMPGLTGKVFRTFNASNTLQIELDKTPDEDLTVNQLVAFYNKANRQVAVLCNHKKTIPKKHGEQMTKYEEKIEGFKTLVKDLKAHAKLLKAGKNPKKRDPDLPKLPTTEAATKKKITATVARVEKETFALQEREANASVALGTSKTNYNDPRITAAWCKMWDVPLAKVFAKTLREKFPWAQGVDEDWSF